MGAQETLEHHAKSFLAIVDLESYPALTDRKADHLDVLNEGTVPLRTSYSKGDWTCMSQTAGTRLRAVMAGRSRPQISPRTGK